MEVDISDDVVFGAGCTLESFDVEAADVDGRSVAHHEIAQQLNQPLGTIKARIRRGLLKLRERIAV